MNSAICRMECAGKLRLRTYKNYGKLRGFRLIRRLWILLIAIKACNLKIEKIHGDFSNKMSNELTVTDIFRRALEIRAANPNGDMKSLKSQIVSEFSGKPFPSPSKLTIPEYDNIAPEEDWTAGLPIVLRGIQNEDWNDLAQGIVISLEQVENYPKMSGREDAPEKQWRNRDKGIAEAEAKNLSKWMPEELMAMAKRNVKS